MVTKNALNAGLALLIVLCSGQVQARAAFDMESRTPPGGGTSPAYCIAEHNIGRMALAVTNIGTFGDGFSQSGTVDLFTGQQVQSCEFPKFSQTK